MYIELYDRALGSVLKSAGDGGKDEGQLKRSGTAAGKGSEMKTRKMSGATGGGKRFVQGNIPIRSEEALEAKVKLDRKIIRAVTTAHQEATSGGAPVATATGSPIGAGRIWKPEANSAVPTQTDPTRANRTQPPESAETAAGKSGIRTSPRCSNCGQFQGPTWKRCPFHH